jgi:hypothetical protein
MTVISRSVKTFALFCLGLSFSVNAYGQKIDSYMNDMREALFPYGTMKGSNCHSLEIDLNGPWANFAIPDGTNKDKPGELTWSVLKADAFRLFIDLSDLDEDKVQNQPMFSLEYLSGHQKGTPYVADTSSVLIFTKGLNSQMKVHVVDFDKVQALRGQTKVTENQMGVTLTERKFAFVLFSDQQHAEVFEKALQKAIVVCKAQ